MTKKSIIESQSSTLTFPSAISAISSSTPTSETFPLAKPIGNPLFSFLLSIQIEKLRLCRLWEMSIKVLPKYCLNWVLERPSQASRESYQAYELVYYVHA